MSKPKVGAQLYTLRNHLKTLPDVQKTLRRVADIGYRVVQLSGLGPVPAEDVAKAAEDAGLEIGSTHYGWDRFQSELDKLIDEHRLFKCSHPAIGGLPGEYFSKDGLKRFIDELEPVAGKLAKAGMDFSYHNHSHELIRYGSRTWLEALYEDAGPELVKAEIDTYWISAGGGDPAEWLEKCAQRMPVIHLKDMCLSPKGEQRFAPVGEGNLNWKRILKKASKGGVKYMMVEQDDCYGMDPFDALAVSYRNLSAMGYE